MLKIGIAIAALAAAAPVPPPRVVSEAREFMAAYARDLNAGDRPALAGRYSRDGAYMLGFAPKMMESRAGIVAYYSGSGWRKPAGFSWTDLSYEALGGDAVAVTGGFAWQAERDAAPQNFAYTAVLRREGGTLKIRIEHENPLPKGRPAP